MLEIGHRNKRKLGHTEALRSVSLVKQPWGIESGHLTIFGALLWALPRGLTVQSAQRSAALVRPLQSYPQKSPGGYMAEERIISITPSPFAYQAAGVIFIGIGALLYGYGHNQKKGRRP